MEQLTLIRTQSENTDFVSLVKQLDDYLAVVDGDDHAFYHQYNKIDSLNHVVILYQGTQPLGCGAMKNTQPASMEIKRMFVREEGRGKGVGTRILAELEDWARELNIGRCILETGKRQPDAIALYEKNGYRKIPNFGQYVGVENSVCFEKEL